MGDYKIKQELKKYGIADEIIENFRSEESAKYVYKITGLRGSGKSVEYSKIIKNLTGKREWLVYTLSAAGNPTETLIAKLSKESFIDDKLHFTSVSSHRLWRDQSADIQKLQTSFGRCQE